MFNLKKKFNKDLKDLFKGGSASFFIRLLGLLVLYVLTAYITNNFGAAVYGDYQFFTVFLMTITILSAFGMDIFMLRYVSDGIAKGDWWRIRSLNRQGSVAMIGVSAVVVVSLLVFQEPLGKIFSISPQFVQYSAFLILPYTLFKIYQQCFRAQKRIIFYSFLENLTHPLLTLFIVLGAVVLGYKNAELPILAHFASVLVVFVIVFVMWNRVLAKNTANQPKPTAPPLKGRDYLSILEKSFPFLLASSLVIIGNKVDQFLIKSMADSVALAIYAVSFKVARLVALPLTAVNSISAPKFSELYTQGKMVKLKHVAQQSTMLIILASTPIFLAIVIFAPFILSLFGEEFKNGVLIIQIVVLGQYFSACSGSVGQFLQMTEQQKILNNITISGLVLNVVLNLILIPKIGVLGAAITSAVTLVYRNGLATYFLYKRFGFFQVNFNFLKVLRQSRNQSGKTGEL